MAIAVALVAFNLQAYTPEDSSEVLSSTSVSIQEAHAFAELDCWSNYERGGTQDAVVCPSGGGMVYCKTVLDLSDWNGLTTCDEGAPTMN